MPRMAVINDTHAVGYEICAWMLKDLGFDVYVAGPSFSNILPIFYHRGYMSQSVTASPLVKGIVELKDLPQDALFVDTMPETEGKLRSLGWKGPYLIYWIWPCWADWVEKNFRPGRRVAAMVFNPAIGRTIREMKLCPFEAFWPPYIKLLGKPPRDRFDQFLLTSIKNANGWSNVALLAKLRDLPETRLELYGGGPPDWAKEVPHDQFLKKLQTAMAVFHPKPTDTPGYVVMEAVHSGVPVILGRDFLRSTEMTDLFVHGETCFHAKQETVEEVMEFVNHLKDSERNRAMGTAARERLLTLSDWKTNRPRIQALVENLMSS